jgi:site-specific DNA-methyltransferase (adenine-specific)
VTPHYQSHGITLYVGDAREILPTLRKGRDGYELLIADPPYGVKAKATGSRTMPLALDRIAGDESTDAGTEIVSAAWPCVAMHRHAYVFGPFKLDGLSHAAGCCELIWDKVIPTMGDLDHPWAKQHEPIQFAMRADGMVNMARRGGKLARVRSGSVLRYQRPNGSGAKHHVSEKPVPLLRELIEMSSRHGETVLDPCAGSGSTLVAALIEGRQAVGIELETQWADVAAERLSKLTRQGDLFGLDVA